MKGVIDVHNGMYLFNSLVFTIAIWKSFVLLFQRRIEDERMKIIIITANISIILFYIQTVSLLITGSWIFRDLWHMVNFLNAITLIFIFTLWIRDSKKN